MNFYTPFVQDLLNKNIKHMTDAHVVLDRVLDATVKAYPRKEFLFNETSQVFQLKLNEEHHINITKDITIGGVMIAFIQNDEFIARLVITLDDGVIDEVYRKIPDKQLRSNVKEYFEILANIDFAVEPKIVNGEATVESDEDDEIELHFGGDDDDE